MSAQSVPSTIADLSNLGAAVVTRSYSWLDFCIRSWGPEWNAPDHRVYNFSSGRSYDSTDKTFQGIYGP